MARGPLVLDATRAGAAPHRLVGAKAMRLGQLAGAGFAVPPFFAVTAEAFAAHLDANAIAWPSAAAGLVPGTEVAIACSPLPPEVAGAVAEAYRVLATPPGGDVAVRSSGAEEDGTAASFAGQFSTDLGIRGEAALLGALRRCWASCLSEWSMAYRAAAGLVLPPSPAFGVVVQAQVAATRAGVLFTRHPLDASAAYVEANFGTGESVVGGLATPDGVTVCRDTRAVLNRVLGTKRRMTAVAPGGGPSTVVEVDPVLRAGPALSDAEAGAIVEAGLRIEALFGVPQDVEWAIDRRQLWILQARPITAGAGAARR